MFFFFNVKKKESSLRQMFALNEMAVLECAYVYVNLPLKTAPPTYPLTFNVLTLTAYLNQL